MIYFLVRDKLIKILNSEFPDKNSFNLFETAFPIAITFIINT